MVEPDPTVPEVVLVDGANDSGTAETGVLLPDELREKLVSIGVMGVNPTLESVCVTEWRVDEELFLLRYPNGVALALFKIRGSSS